MGQGTRIYLDPCSLLLDPDNNEIYFPPLSAVQTLRQR